MQFNLVSWDSVVRVVAPSGEEVVFDITSYRSARLEKAGEIFQVVNDYMSRLKPLTTAALFGLYLEAKQILMVTTTVVDLDNKLENVLRKIFNLIDLEGLRSYVVMYSGIAIPGDIKNTYEDVDGGFIRDKTYIREEYIELLSMTIAVRLCLPIWGEYMSKVEGSSGSDGKEYAAYSLLAQSKVKEMPAYSKLLNYVEASTTSAVETSAATLKGVGRYSVPEWLTSMVMVRKLPVIDLLSVGNRANIINAVYSYVDNHLLRLGKKFMDDARERRNEGSGGSDEQEQSYIETYRAKQQMAYGDLETNIVYLEGDLLECCRDVDQSFDPSILDAVLAVSDGLENGKLSVHNHVLTQWVMDGCLDTLEPDTISRVVTVRAMLVTQAILHHWGLHHLALLVTGIRMDNRTGHVEGSGFNKLTTAQIDSLDQIYPNQTNTGRQTASKNKNGNYGYLSVMDMSRLLTKYKYAVRTPAFISVKEVNVDRYGHLTVPPTISNEIAEMLIKIDNITPEPTYAN